MGMTRPTLALAMAAVMALVGCGEQRDSLSVPEFPRRLFLDGVADGTIPADSESGSELFFARTQEQAERELLRLFDDVTAIEEFDFDTQILIGILGGCQPDSGYRIELSGVELDRRQLTITGKVSRDPEVSALQVLSNPYLLVSLPVGILESGTETTLELNGADRCTDRPAKETTPPPS
jgi:hypothetical protein